ncbi:hypothetical protein [Roseovarius indicus]|uniref:hypothetical protein n=1 Tax=Roseovarius indicus TaxID=540747 RepID=UPI003517C310
MKLRIVGAVFAMLAAAHVSSGVAQETRPPLAGFGAPDWYVAHRIVAHTRLSPNQRNANPPPDPAWQKAFEHAGHYLRQMGATVLIRHLRTRGELPPWRTDSPSHGLAEDMLDNAHLSGLHLIGYYWHSSDEEQFAAHPDWSCDDRRGRPEEHRARGRYLDFASGYGEVVAGQLAEIASFDFDGAYLDGRSYPPAGCFGSALEQQYRSGLGLLGSLSGLARTNGYVAGFRQYQGRRLAEIVAGWHERLPLGKDFALIVSTASLATLINPEMPADMARTGIPKTEYGTAIRPGLNLRLFERAPELAATRPADATRIGAGIDFLATVSRVPPSVWINGINDETKLRRAVGVVVTHGGVANIDIAEKLIPPGADGARSDRAVYERLFALDQRMAPYFEAAERPQFAAILLSEAARNSRSPEVAWRDVVGPAVAAYGALVARGLPVALIDDRILDANDLGQYRHLIVPAGAIDFVSVAETGPDRVIIPPLGSDPTANRDRLQAALEPVYADEAAAPLRVAAADPGYDIRFWTASGGKILVSAVVSSETTPTAPVSLSVFMAGEALSGYCVTDVLEARDMGRYVSTFDLDAILPWQVLSLAPCE